jgi:hypothetical protein
MYAAPFSRYRFLKVTLSNTSSLCIIWEMNLNLREMCHLIYFNTNDYVLNSRVIVPNQRHPIHSHLSKTFVVQFKERFLDIM